MRHSSADHLTELSKETPVIPRFLTASLLVPLAAFTASDNVPVRVKLSDDVYAIGEQARVNVKVAKDGYLVVLRVDGDGNVRVIYPVDPGANDAVKGGKEIEVRSRGGREAFMVSEKGGTGLVLAARSDTPFNFSQFMNGQHWNFDALVPKDANGDPEAAMVSLVDRMGDGHYDYDAVTYRVDAHAQPRYGYYDPYYPPFRVYGGFGYYNSWPWLYGPRFGARVVIPIRPFRGRR
jgi:hypothetical protein